MAKKFNEIHEVTFYECDINGTMTLPMLLNSVIKTSEAQSEQLQVSTDQLQKLGITWVITQHEMNIHRLPKVGQLIKITTQGTSYNKYFCYREFWVQDKETGEQLAHIFSTFVLMDLTTRKMISVPDDLLVAFESEKIKRIHKGPHFHQPTDGAFHQPYRVRFSDIDSNKHVNNAKYLDWMVDCLDYDKLTQYLPQKVWIKFEKEISYGHTIDSFFSQRLLEEHDQFWTDHEIFVEGNRCASANILWRKRK